MNMRSLALAAALAAAAAPCSAATFTGTGYPGSNSALAGGTVITFTGDQGTYPTGFIKSGVTFGGGTLIVGDDGNRAYVGDHGAYLQNNYGGTQSFTFAFGTAVSAFGFNLGATDYNWLLTAYSGSDVVDSLPIAPIHGDTSGRFYGISGSNITSAVLTHAGGDWVILDNFTFAGGQVSSAVPEPSVWALMILGLGAVGAALRRRKPKLALNFS